MATKRRRRKRINTGRFVRFIIILLLFIGGIVSLFLYAPFFNVKEVAVVGNDAVASEEIIKSSGIIFGSNIFKVDKSDVAKSIKTIPRVDTVNVRRKIPKKIEVEICETYPRVIIPYMSGFVVTNEYGKVIEMKDDISGLELPVLEGIKIKDAKVCQKIVTEDELTFDIIVDCLSQLMTKDVLAMFKTVDFSNITNLSGYTVDDVKIIFGKMTDLEYKVKVLSDVMQRIEKKEGAYIDLTTPSATFYGNINDEPKKEETEGEEAESGENAEGEKTENGEASEGENDAEVNEEKTENEETKEKSESSNESETGESASAE